MTVKNFTTYSYPKLDPNRIGHHYVINCVMSEPYLKHCRQSAQHALASSTNNYSIQYCLRYLLTKEYFYDYLRPTIPYLHNVTKPIQ